MTAQSESSPRSTGGENQNMGKWRILLRRLGGRRRVRDNLYGLHEMRPYDSGRRSVLQSVLARIKSWRKGVQPQSSVNRMTRARFSTRAPRRRRG
jgi:hypothetical protein